MSNELSASDSPGSGQKVLIAYVPNPVGDAVFAAGLEEAADKNCPAVVVNVPRAGRAVDRKMIDEATKDRLANKAAAVGVEFDMLQPVDADPVSAIRDLVESGCYTVLVIGLRKRSAVGKFVMGSTAQRLLLDIDIPVLSVKSESDS